MLGGVGIFGIPSYINKQTGIGWDFYGFLISIVVSFILGFLLVFFIGFKDKNNAEKLLESGNENKSLVWKIIRNQLKGKAIKLSEVDDEAF